MTNDFYAEYLVSKASTGMDTVKKILIGLGTALVAGFFLAAVPMMGILMAGLVFYGGYYLLTGVDVEYEYIITNGDLDIDKVIGKRKRKRLITAPIGTFTAFGKLSEAGEEPDNTTTVLASGGNGEEFYCDFVHKSVGNVRIIFTPSEKIIEGIGIFLPRQLKLEFNRKYAVKKTASQDE